MKNIWKYALMVVLAACFVAPVASKVEAAKLAVVPLIIDEKVEDEQGLNPILFTDAVSKVFEYPAYDLVADTDLVRQVALEQQDKLFTKEGLQAVATATKADIVVAMSLDKYRWDEIRIYREPVTRCDFRGRFAYLNTLTGKWKVDTWRDDAERETESISPREDWPHKELARYFRVTLKKALSK